MRTRSLLSLGLLCLAACGAADPSGNPPAPMPTPPSLTCSATTSPGTVPYAINGKVMTLGTGSDSQSLTRLKQAKGYLPVFGTWSLGTQKKDGLTETGTLTVGEDSVLVTSQAGLGRRPLRRRRPGVFGPCAGHRGMSRSPRQAIVRSEQVHARLPAAIPRQT
jgi:hypothetical protein